LDKRLLESFVAVYRSGSLVEAAERLNISQSALSRRISDFQRRLGIDLFEPHGRGMIPTDRAQHLLPRALNALEAITELEAASDLKGMQPTRQLIVAATAHTIETIIARPAAEFVRRHDSIRIGFLEAGGIEIEDLILSGKASLGITGRPRFDTGLTDRPLARLDIMAAAATPFSAAETRNGIDLRVLCERDLLVMDRRHQSRTTFDAAARLLQLSPTILHEGGSASMILGLARAGLGTAVVTSKTDLHATRIVANGVALGLDLSAMWDPTLRWRTEVEQLAEAVKTSLTPVRVGHGPRASSTGTERRPRRSRR
jgi:DNA-binding transcriptional LysR family regulator